MWLFVGADPLEIVPHPPFLILLSPAPSLTVSPPVMAPVTSCWSHHSQSGPSHRVNFFTLAFSTLPCARSILESDGVSQLAAARTFDAVVVAASLIAGALRSNASLRTPPPPCGQIVRRSDVGRYASEMARNLSYEGVSGDFQRSRPLSFCWHLRHRTLTQTDSNFSLFSTHVGSPPLLVSAFGRGGIPAIALGSISWPQGRTGPPPLIFHVRFHLKRFN